MVSAPGRSLWADTVPDDEHARPDPPPPTTVVDVAIVGAGLTGLWTAWYLARQDPTIRIRVVEREHIGFGASGRNGGWSSALLPMGLDRIAARAGPAAATRFQRAMYDTVREIEDFVVAHGHPDLFHRGGTIDLARSAPEEERLRDTLATYRRFGFGESDHRWLDASEARTVCGATKVGGGLFTPHCGAVHPLRLTHAVARAALGAGVEIQEGVTVHAVHEHRLDTSHGTITADVVVRATEGYTSGLDGERRTLLPLYSLMIATEPLPAEIWSEIGLAGRSTFADARHEVVYGQRTADDRIALGGRGAPYHFGSAVRPDFDTDGAIRQRLIDTLGDMFPCIREASVTHHWGGVLAAPRDWQCGVRYDRRTGLASAGGYVGDGVSTTNLAGRTLAALITGSDDDLLTLPWVGHRSRRWEPEPLRWLGVNALGRAARLADRNEQRTDSGSRVWGRVVDAVRRS